MIRIDIAKDYSYTPGPRLKTEGDFSGELFRETILLPAVREAVARNDRILVDLDGTSGFGTSFLEESFGGLIRNDKIDDVALKTLLTLQSLEEPWLVDEVWGYINDASR
ncbi:STAS-like domain-containing protein [Gimesia maris]|uniref:STAS-like domain-containing protein n=1 Tax=Gimesia maris TaxID=122 RepID=UPI003A9009AE